MSERANLGRYGWRLYLNRILSIWKKKGNILSFSEVHKEFVRLGIVSDVRYKASTYRILKRLIEEGYLEKVGNKYKLKVSPKPFDILEKIDEIRRKYGDKFCYEWRTGGLVWVLAEGAIFGMPNDVHKNPAYDLILGILLVRLARIFDAIKSIAVAAKMVKNNGGDVTKAPIPRTAIREFILSIVPYVLGEISGIDGDGLPEEELLESCKIILKALPEEINSQPIMKDVLQTYVHCGERLYERSFNLEGILDKATLLGDRRLEGKIHELEKVILVAYPPRWIVDEQYDERELYEMLKHSIEEGFSNAMLLAHMRTHDEKVVFRVLQYLEPMLGEDRASELKELYGLARAGMVLDSIVLRYFEAKTRSKELSKVLEDLRKEIRLVKRKYGYTVKDMIKGVWLSNWSTNIVPSFARFSRSKNVVEFVENAIEETFEALRIKVPGNLSQLVRKGYELVKSLDEQLHKDSKLLSELLKRKS